MTAEEIVVAALARAMELSNEVPTTRSVYYRRITTRQQQLFVRAAEINPDYFGLSVSVALVAGVANLAGLATQAERVNGVRINGVGTSAYATGARVNIVPVDDSEYAGLPPRATLRDYVLTQTDTDLSLVASVWIDYSKRPLDVLNPTDVPQLPAQFHELLVIDCAMSAAKRMFGLAKQMRGDYLALLVEEEGELTADFERHVERFAMGEESRFGRTARPIARPRAES